MTNKLYTAKLVPVDRFNHVYAPDGEHWEMFDLGTFAAAVAHPEQVVVDRGHAERELGRLTALRVKDGWWECTFKVNHPAAEHLVEVGTPVSVGFVPLLTRDGYHQCARLENVSLVDRPSYADARVTDVLELREPAPALELDDADEATRRLLARRVAPGMIVRNFGRVERVG